MDFLLDERIRELYGEESRRFTLIRTGKLLERVRKYNPEARDLIQDFFGKAEVPVGEEADGSENTVTIDFTQTNWTAITRVAWAAIRTATPSLPGYREWLRGVGETNLRELNEALLPEAVRKFFR